MCLTCGFIGCSRQQWQGHGETVIANSHMLRHFGETGHSFAQNLESQRVWDYTNGKQAGLLALFYSYIVTMGHVVLSVRSLLPTVS